MATKTKASSTTVLPVNREEGSASQLNAGAVGPGTDDIKQRFGAQKIPLAGDFAELIEIADVGRKAAGLHPNQSGAGAGLKLAETGQLAVNAKTNGGLDSTASGVEVKAGAGIAVGTTGVSVARGNGVTATGPVGVVAKTNGGLDSTASGVEVKAGPGITVNDSGVSIAQDVMDRLVSKAALVGLSNADIADVFYRLNSVVDLWKVDLNDKAREFYQIQGKSLACVALSSLVGPTELTNYNQGGETVLTFFVRQRNKGASRSIKLRASHSSNSSGHWYKINSPRLDDVDNYFKLEFHNADAGNNLAAGNYYGELYLAVRSIPKIFHKLLKISIDITV